MMAFDKVLLLLLVFPVGIRVSEVAVIRLVTVPVVPPLVVAAMRDTSPFLSKVRVAEISPFRSMASFSFDRVVLDPSSRKVQPSAR